MSVAVKRAKATRLVVSKNPDQAPPRFELIDVDVDRNAYGRQIHSFVGEVEWQSGPGPGTGEGVFIRAPKFVRIGEGVNVIARREDEVVAVQQGRCVACCFHPSLS